MDDAKPGWARDPEIRRTWAGHVTVDAAAGEAILVVETTTTERLCLRVPAAALAALVGDLEWAASRLAPAWTGDPESNRP